MNTTTNIDALSVFIFLGVFLGLMLSVFYIFKSTANIKANRYQGFMLLSLSLCFIELLLNRTGYIVKVLPLTFSTASLNFLIGPFLYLYIKKSIDSSSSKKEWVHFIFPALYLLYLSFDLIQSNEFKYNCYVISTHPGWQLLHVNLKISNDPLNINQYLDLLLAIQILFYILVSFVKLVIKANESGKTIFSTKDANLKSLRNAIFHVSMIILIFIVVKLTLHGNAGNYFIGIYVAIFNILTTFRVMYDSSYFDQSAFFMDISIGKYSKSSLNEVDKMRILDNITSEFASKHYFSNNLASLSDLAKKIGESPHHVSQVINEKLNQSFFELLASYRVDEAKRVLADKTKNNLTVEEVSEIVGYNSKAAFNNAFKRLTDKTPSEYRRNGN